MRNEELVKFNVKVSDKIESISLKTRDNQPVKNNDVLQIEEGAKAYLILNFTGASNTSYGTSIPSGKVDPVSDNKSLVEAEIKNNLLILSPKTPLPTGTITASSLLAKIDINSSQLGLPTKTPISFYVQLKQASAYVTLTDSVITLVKDSSQEITAQVTKAIANQEDTGATFSWKPATDEDGKWIEVSGQGKKATIVWKPTVAPLLEKDRPAIAIVKLTARTSDGQLLPDVKVIVSMKSVVGFAPMDIRMNILDRQTVRDLFGGVTDNEYYVIAVRMYNNLKDEKQNEYIGASILVYNGSLEVGVLLQKQYDKDSKADLNKKKDDSYKNPSKWHDVDLADFNNIRGVPSGQVDPGFRMEKKEYPTCSGDLIR
ncbi:MAG: hypothetical protein ACT4O9_13220 [Blastocatellia bacterium]